MRNTSIPLIEPLELLSSGNNEYKTAAVDTAAANYEL